MVNIRELSAYDLSASGMEGYLRWILENGPSSAAPNIREDMLVLRVDETLVPVVVNRGKTRNCWLTSLIAFYFGEGSQELCAGIRPRIVGKALSNALRLLGSLLALGGMDRSVLVNNWLLTQNPPSRLSSHQLPELLSYLEHRFPGYLIVVSSLNRVLNCSSIDALLKRGGIPLTKRQVYFIDKNLVDCSRKRNVRSNIRLFRKAFVAESEPGIHRASDHEIVRDLYRALYIEKYSRFNPDYTTEWFRLIDAIGWCSSRYLYRKESTELLAFCLDRTIDADNRYFLLAGYRKWDRKHNPLRGAYGAVLESFIASDVRRLWLSAGVDEFKVHLGAMPCLEYDVLVLAHLGPVRRLRATLLYSTLSRLTDAYYRGVRKRLGLTLQLEYR